MERFNKYPRFEDFEKNSFPNLNLSTVSEIDLNPRISEFKNLARRFLFEKGVIKNNR